MITAALSTFTDDLIFLFENEPSLALVYGTNLFKGAKARLPEGNVLGALVSIYRTGGDGDEGTHNSIDVPAYESPRGQIVSRHVDYDVAERMALQLYAFMWPIQNTFINGTWWRELNVRGEPFDLPLDEKGRARVAFNIDCVKRVSPASS